MKRILWICIMVVCSGTIHAWNSETLDGWTLGVYAPEISSTRVKADGTTGPTIHLLLGTSPFYYDVGEAGEGSVDFWIYDGGYCIEIDAGYGARGPQWGLVNQSGNVVTAGIYRASYVDGCRGYELWSNVNFYGAYTLKEGLRDADNVPWSGGWYKWTANGLTDDITYTLYDVDYDSLEGPGTVVAHGDVVVTIDASFDEYLAPAFGEGWSGFFLKGDGMAGIEDISVEIVSGTGIFSEAGMPVAVTEEYEKSGWGMVKGMFR